MTYIPKIEKLLTLQEVADILRVNRSSVSRLIKGKMLSYIEVGGRKLVAEQDLLAFIDKQRVKSDEDCGHIGD